MTATTQESSILRFTISKPILAWRAKNENELGKRMMKWTETWDAPQQRHKRTFHNEAELVSLASEVQFFGSHHKRLTKKQNRNDNKNASSQNPISKSIRKRKKDFAKFRNKQVYTARGESTPLSCNPPSTALTSNFPSRLQVGQLLHESIQQTRSGGTLLLMPHIHKWSVSSVCPTQRFVPSEPRTLNT